MSLNPKRQNCLAPGDWLVLGGYMLCACGGMVLPLCSLPLQQTAVIVYGTLVLLIALPFTAELFGKQGDLLNPRNIFVGMYVCYFVVWPIWVDVADYQGIFGIKFMWTGTNDLEGRAILFTSVVALLSFDAGFFCFPRLFYLRRESAMASDSARKASPSFHEFAFPGVTVSVLVIVASLAYLGISSRAGGAMTLLENIDEWRAQAYGSAPLMWGTSLAAFAASLGLLHAAASKRHRVLTALLMASSVALLLVSGNRMDAITAIIGFVVIWHYSISRIQMSWKLVGGGILFIAANGLYVSFRATGSPFGFLEFAKDLNLVDLAFAGVFSRFTGPESLYRSMEVADNGGPVGLYYFVQDLIFSWIPRSLLPDKPATFGFEINLLLFGDVFSLANATSGASTPTLVGEAYLIGQLEGVVLIMALVGAILGAVYNWIPFTRSWVALAFYSKFCVFAFFVNETFTLHFLRLLQALVVWGVVLLVVSYELVVRQELQRALSLATQGATPGLLRVNSRNQ